MKLHFYKYVLCLSAFVSTNHVRALPATSVTGIGGIFASLSPGSIITCNLVEQGGGSPDSYRDRTKFSAKKPTNAKPQNVNRNRGKHIKNEKV